MSLYIFLYLFLYLGDTNEIEETALLPNQSNKYMFSNELRI